MNRDTKEYKFLKYMGERMVAIETEMKEMERGDEWTKEQYLHHSLLDGRLRAYRDINSFFTKLYGLSQTK